MATHTRFASTCLWDVLSMLPLDVVRTNVWLPLSHDDRSHLRSACRQSQQLANSLITKATHNMGGVGHRADNWSWRHNASLGQWAQYVDQRSPCLSHLPGVTHLHLFAWRKSSFLAAALLAYGRATQRRVLSLDLTATDIAAPWEFTHTVAISASCPNLASLTLHRMHLEYDALLPLRDLAGLTKLEVIACNDTNTLAACADLVGLRDLHVDMWNDEFVHLIAFVCMTAMAKLTQLTALKLAQMVGDDVWKVRDGQLPDALGAAVAALAGLTNLRALRFNTDAILTDAAFSAVRQLTLLTELHVCHLELSAHTEGHLPLLQWLCCSAELSPRHLLQSLSPLLPLPSLTKIGAGQVGEPFLCLPLKYLQDTTEDSVMAAESHALKQIASVLESAPRLELRGLCLSNYDGAHALFVSPLMDDLKPLLHMFNHLEVHHSTISVHVVLAMANRLPALSNLRVETCKADDACLWTISALLTGLTELTINDLEAPLLESSILALAVVPRQHVLTVYGDVFKDSQQIWDAAQLIAHGRRLMVLGEGDGRWRSQF